MRVQGDKTDLSSVDEVRQAVKEQSECTVRLLNYRKDGTPFWNMLSIAPMSDVDGAVCFYIGVQVDVTSKDAAPAADGMPQVNQAAAKQAMDTAKVQSAVTHMHSRQQQGAGKDPFAVIPHSALRVKPHVGADRAWQALYVRHPACTRCHCIAAQERPCINQRM